VESCKYHITFITQKWIAFVLFSYLTRAISYMMAAISMTFSGPRYFPKSAVFSGNSSAEITVPRQPAADRRGIN
jgi:hypothetical protein